MLAGLLVILLIHVTTQCPSEWVSFNNHCYFIKSSKAKLTYRMAEESCKNLQPESYLLTLDTRFEYEFLKYYLSQHFSSFTDINNGWLTSGRRVDGVWVWDTTGETIDQAVFDWGPRQPENRKNSLQKCLSFWPKSGFLMSDTFCWTYQRQFICELEERATPSCPTDWAWFNNHCYYIKPSKAKLTYRMAEDSCKTLQPKSYLVTLETRAEYEFLKYYMSQHSSSFTDIDNGWLTSGRKVKGVWLWHTNGEPIDQTVFDWGPRQPENRTTSQQKCLSFWPKSRFLMYDTFCWPFERQFICEVEEKLLDNRH